MLLPGDIQKSGEDRLLSKSFPPIDVLIAPHHGSLSSSSPPFLNHLSPGRVIISAVHLNRFVHPHRRFLARYHNRRMTVLNTASSSAVTLDVDKWGVMSLSKRAKRDAASDMITLSAVNPNCCCGSNKSSMRSFGVLHLYFHRIFSVRMLLSDSDAPSWVFFS